MIPTYLTKKYDAERIIAKGSKIYERVKEKYEPKHHGEYLAIDTNTGRVYLADDGAKALMRALEDNPKGLLYSVRIGFDTLETMAWSLLHEK